jgi:MFS family permease
VWFLAIFGAVILLMIFFCLPETLAKRAPVQPADAAQSTQSLSRMSTRQSVQQHTKRTAKFLQKAFVAPLGVLLYLRFPPIAITVFFASVTFGALFVLNIAIQSSFSAPPYGFPELIVGLLYLPSSLGYFSASALGGRWIDNIMAREARRAGRYDASGKLIYLPEDRMRENAWIAGTVYPAALIWFGWTAQHGIIWPVPAVANFFFGIGSMLVFSAATTMLTEFMPNRSSGGIAINNFVRNIFSCTGAIVTQPLINAMGVGWVCTMIGLIAWVTGYLSIWLLRQYGPKWRVEMDKTLNPQRA